MPYNYQLFHFDLTAALSERIPLEGGFVYIKEASDSSAYVNVRVDDNTADNIKLFRKTGIITKFKELFLNAPAQAGKTIDVLITEGYEEFRVLEQSIQDVNVTNDFPMAGLRPTVYNNACAVANTEYSSNFPAGTTSFAFRARGGDIKLRSAPGGSYITILNGSSYSQENLETGVFYYFESPTAGAVLELIVWTNP